MTSSESLLVLTSRSPAETAAIGARLGARLRAGDVVFLRGQLGAGKTTLARGLISAWTGRDEEAPSPTYTLVQTYEGLRGDLWHVDLYRLSGAEDARELGLEDCGAALVVEWPERLGADAPADRIEIAIETRGEDREIAVSGTGSFRGAKIVD
jgi:tRNA threonylcarbamoyladenosine biosynthesis protein TsaE